jgi:hypothetical protein
MKVTEGLVWKNKAGLYLVCHERLTHGGTSKTYSFTPKLDEATVNCNPSWAARRGLRAVGVTATTIVELV